MAEECVNHIFLECLEQDISGENMSAEELQEFAKRESEFWHSIPEDRESIYQVGDARFHGPKIVQFYKDHWKRIIVLQGNEISERMEAIFRDAQQLRFVLSKGSIGQKLKKIEFADPGQRNMALAMFSGAIFSFELDQKRKVAFLFDALQLHPGFDAGLSLATAIGAEQEIKKTLTFAREEQDNAETFFSTKKEEIQRLHELYEQKLQLEWPSTYWRDAAKKATFSARLWLGVFGFMVLAPVIMLFWNFDLLASRVAGMSPESGSISLGTAALITAPIFAYGWLLKHISRGFVQNFQLAADAAHRRMMVLTYLAIAKRKYTEIGQGDRALILNALFRPAPPNTNDDGPPSGILDLIRK